MLGKASEGAWIELGVSLAALVGDSNSTKWTTELLGPDAGFAKKLRDVLHWFKTRLPRYKPVAEGAGISLSDLRLALLWSETLRDARNSIHHGVQTPTTPNFETVSTFLLTATTHLPVLHKLYEAAIDAYALSRRTSATAPAGTP
jgi:hypothetical protein